MEAERQSQFDLGTATRNTRFFIKGNVPALKRFERIVLYPDREQKPYGCGARLGPTAEVMKWMQGSRSQWMYQRDHWWACIEGAVRPLRIHFQFIRRDERPFNTINALAAVLDCMIARKWINTAFDKDVMPIIEPKGVDREEPGLLLWLDDDNG